MAAKTTSQLSFADGLIYRRAGVNEILDRVDQAIDWKRVEQILDDQKVRGPGAPGYPALVLFKAVLLAQWHNLSDEAMESMLADRLSFQRFCGLGLSDPKPDHTTLWRYREALGASSKASRAFEEVQRQLCELGLILKQGTLIDATLVGAQAVPPPPPPKGDTSDQAGSDGERPPSLLIKSKTDGDAGWTRRGKERFFGYKAHVAVDLGSGLIRSQRLTGAEVNETSVADDLIQGDESTVYADKAYSTHARTEKLHAMGICDMIQRRANKHWPLSRREVLRNKRISRIRGRVETVFAYFKRIFFYRRVRYFNAQRNSVQLALLCLAYNLNKVGSAAKV